jgi:hypothetical protein
MLEMAEVANVHRFAARGVDELKLSSWLEGAEEQKEMMELTWYYWCPGSKL